MTKFEAIFSQFSQALKRFEEVLAMEKTDIIRDSAIQRFEITFDLAWKSIKAYMQEFQKIRCASPKTCFREAYTQKLIEYEDKWLAIADDRNATAHLYKEEMANQVYDRMPQYLELFQSLEQALKAQNE